MAVIDYTCSWDHDHEDTIEIDIPGWEDIALSHCPDCNTYYYPQPEPHECRALMCHRCNSVHAPREPHVYKSIPYDRRDEHGNVVIFSCSKCAQGMYLTISQTANYQDINHICDRKRF